MYNIIFTGVPIAWYAVFDFQYQKNVLMFNPSLYAYGMKEKGYNFNVFWGWVLYGFW